MTLLDHFRPPLGLRRHWHAFHNSWATYISSDLNRSLPVGYFAEANVQFGVEIDVAAFEKSGFDAIVAGGWEPPRPTQTLRAAIVTDVAEVLVFQQEGGPILAGGDRTGEPGEQGSAGASGGVRHQVRGDFTAGSGIGRRRRGDEPEGKFTRRTTCANGLARRGADRFGPVCNRIQDGEQGRRNPT